MKSCICGHPKEDHNRACSACLGFQCHGFVAEVRLPKARVCVGCQEEKGTVAFGGQYFHRRCYKTWRNVKKEELSFKVERRETKA